MFKKNLFITIFLLAFLGCTVGVKLDPDIIRQEILKGTSTKNDVLAICGQPQGKRMSADNQKEVWHYAYVKKGVTGRGVVAHIARVGTEMKSHKVVLDVEFQDNIVSNYTLEEGNTTKFNYQ
ncbi:MAG: hypothetical protein SWC96_03635 [Thermodesulfobacteriota bacterium]|nr:hypothetical protein [Thermodesulfobacteriota bacterium]